MEGVERINTMVVRRLGQRMGASSKRDSYAMKVDHRRNCYACGSFGHMAHHCRNRGQRERVEQGRRLEYGRSNIEENHRQTSNLKKVENLKSLN